MQKQELDLESLQEFYTSTYQLITHDCAAIHATRPCEAGEIRLLTFCTESTFTLEKVCLREDPDYDAVSYCWGTAEDCHDVRINDRNVKLRGNVYSMLSQLHRQHAVTRVWIDLICINQNDQDERSEQVTLMGEIYNKAAKVYAWLGELDPEIGLVFDVMGEFRDIKFQGKYPTGYKVAEQLFYHRQLFREIWHKKAGNLPEKSDLDDEKLEEFNWLRPLYTRPYWGRVWIVQELVLAKTPDAVVVCCGEKSINFDDIYGLSLDWRSFEQGFRVGMPEILDWSSVEELRGLDPGSPQMLESSTFEQKINQTLKPQSRGWDTIRMIRAHQCRREPDVEMPFERDPGMVWEDNTEMAEHGKGAMFDEVIGVYALHHRCKDMKDKVYGFRELVPQWKEKLVVNYNQSVLDVFLDVAKLDLFEPQKLGGWFAAFELWSAMGLGDEEKLKDCLREHLPAIYHQQLWL